MCRLSHNERFFSWRERSLVFRKLIGLPFFHCKRVFPKSFQQPFIVSQVFGVPSSLSENEPIAAFPYQVFQVFTNWVSAGTRLWWVSFAISWRQLCLQYELRSWFGSYNCFLLWCRLWRIFVAAIDFRSSPNCRRSSSILSMPALFRSFFLYVSDI